MGTIIDLEFKYFSKITHLPFHLVANRGNNPRQFHYPVRIAIDPNNNVLVIDLCIHLFTHNLMINLYKQ